MKQMPRLKCVACGRAFSRSEVELNSRPNDLYFQENKTHYCDSCLKLFDYHGVYRQGAVHDRYRLTLLENSIDFMNSSLSAIISFHSKQDHKSVKYAIIHLVFAIELLIKEILRNHDPLLVFEHQNGAIIARGQRTVSWKEAIARLKTLFPEELASIDNGRLEMAQRLRNQIIHYDVEYNLQRALRDYSSLMELTQEMYHRFLEARIAKPLDKFIYPENWQEEQTLCRYFRTECTTFNGFVVYKSFMEEQKYTHIILLGDKYERIRFGQERLSVKNQEISLGYYEYACHDCDAVEGLYHSLGCDVEVCPRCNGQLLSCGCVDILSSNDFGE